MQVFGKNIKKARLHLPQGGFYAELTTGIPFDASDLLFHSFSIQKKERLDIHRCFNKSAHIFALGDDTAGAVITINFIHLLNTSCEKQTSLQELYDGYLERRISDYTQGDYQFTIGNFSVPTVYLIGFQIGDVRPETMTCAVSYTFLAAEK